MLKFRLKQYGSIIQSCFPGKWSLHKTNNVTRPLFKTWLVYSETSILQNLVAGDFKQNVVLKKRKGYVKELGLIKK
jgi:hypothetical protein